MILSYGTMRTAFAERCWESQRRYAEKTGHGYVCEIIGPDEFPHRHKIDLLLKHAPASGKVMYLDWDVYVEDDADSLFSNDAPFATLGYNCKIPWTCTALMLADIGVFRRMQPHYWRYYADLPHNSFREEIATNYAAIEIGAGLNPVFPAGFHHKGGRKKWQNEGLQPTVAYVKFGRGHDLYWAPEARNLIKKQGHPVYRTTGES